MSWNGFLPKNAVVMARVGRPAPAVEAPDAPSELAPVTATVPVMILVLAESKPDDAGLALLSRMMSAIQVTSRSYVVEWGDFPVSQAPFVLGLGLEARKGARLSALRPEWVALPSLTEISGDPSRKREAWEKLQSLQARMKVEGLIS